MGREAIVRGGEQAESRLLRTLRPHSLKEFIGQERIKDDLRVHLEAAAERGDVLDHILLCAPTGQGKTTLAMIIAAELGVKIKISSGPVIERPGNLAEILTGLSDGDVLFIDEIHRLRRNVEELLYPVMEEFKLDLVIGERLNERPVRIDLPRFTLIGATERKGLLNSALIDKFGIVYEFEPYSYESLTSVTLRIGHILGIEIGEAAARGIARRAGGRISRTSRLLKQARDYAQVRGDGIITPEVLEATWGSVPATSKSVSPIDKGAAFEEKCLWLLKCMGFQATKTAKSNDGGVDIIAISSSPVVAGKYIVQCKDWSSPVGVEVVRELYGVIHSEDANKGILIATSGFTQAAQSFAAEKRLELIGGEQLDRLLAQYGAERNVSEAEED